MDYSLLLGIRAVNEDESLSIADFSRHNMDIEQDNQVAINSEVLRSGGDDNVLSEIEETLKVEGQLEQFLSADKKWVY